jgi:hypothetical protein
MIEVAMAKCKWGKHRWEGFLNAMDEKTKASGHF